MSDSLVADVRPPPIRCSSSSLIIVALACDKPESGTPSDDESAVLAEMDVSIASDVDIDRTGRCAMIVSNDEMVEDRYCEVEEIGVETKMR